MKESIITATQSSPEAVDRDPRPRARRRGWRPPGLAIVVALLALAGVLTVMYPTIAAWFSQKTQSEVIERLSAEVGQLPATGLDDAIAQAHAYNDALTGSSALLGSYENVPQGEATAAGVLAYAEVLRADGTGLIGRIKIPAIAVDLPIYHGTSDATLLRGVGHLEGTALPVGGEGTHSVLTGHRGLADAELFTHLDAVSVGDTFTIEVFGQVLTYRVTGTTVVDPSDTETLYPVRGKDLVTLVTCTPLGINSQRILVTGERVTPTPVEELQHAGEVPDVPGFPWWAVVLASAVLVLTVYVWLMGRRRPQGDLAIDPPQGE